MKRIFPTINKGFMFTKIANFFSSMLFVQHDLTPRSFGKKIDPKIQGKELRPTIKTILVTTPWYAALILAYMYWLASTGHIAPDALKYGVFKAGLAIVLTLLADFSLFVNMNNLPTIKNSPIRYVSRAVVFLGICWMLSIA